MADQNRFESKIATMRPIVKEERSASTVLPPTTVLDETGKRPVVGGKTLDNVVIAKKSKVSRVKVGTDLWTES